MKLMHVVWDWNGTLVDDLPVVIDSVNGALGAIGEQAIDADDYRAHYTRPVYRFYESLLDRTVTRSEWETLDRVFHDRYSASLDRVPLAEGANAALDAVEARGWTQSILSMWWEADLTACVARRGLTDRMTLIQGNRNDGGGTKAAHLRRHLAALDLEPTSAVLIGDSLDDAAAAQEVGARCVLYDGGSHHPDELVRTGAPVVGSLTAAIGVAAGIAQ
ncbi:MAG: HAD family hydrolase [Actinomycetota bacterium]